MLRLFAIAVLVYFSWVVDCRGQHTQKQDPFPDFNHALFIVPQYVALSGMRLDYEMKMNNSKKWMVFSPQFFTDRNGYEAYETMSGIGLNACYKTFLSHSTRVNENGVPRTNVYFATGPMFQSFRLTGPEEVPEVFTEDGIDYIRFTTQEVTSKIYRPGFNADFGMQFIFDRFALDLYGGIGLRLAFDDNWEIMDDFNDYWTDFGFTGFLLNGGIRLGFIF